ncbi:hypothetical protein [Streptomyces sp. NPDC001927]
MPGGAAGGGVVPGAVLPEDEDELEDELEDGAGVVPGWRGDGDVVLDVVPLVVGDGVPSRGIRATDPDGATAPFGEEPAPTAA